jgi:anti-anti-sigma factor
LYDDEGHDKIIIAKMSYFSPFLTHFRRDRPMTASADPLVLVTCQENSITARVGCHSLTEAHAAALDRELAALVAGRDRPVVTLDLAAVRFLGSMVVGKLVALNRFVRAAGGRLTLANVAPHVREVFAVCRLGGVLDVAGVGAAGPSAQAVRTLAHRKWEQAGRPGGDGVAFWCAAERELLSGV